MPIRGLERNILYALDLYRYKKSLKIQYKFFIQEIYCIAPESLQGNVIGL